MHATLPLLEKSDFPALSRAKLETLQVNLGYRCNQQCLHCHVNAGPKRTEEMSAETIEQIITFIKANRIKRLDLTGGAPELNQHFRQLVTTMRNMDVHVIDRCNLTILQEPGQEDLAQFLADHQVEITASLPCYLKENVESQRGRGVYERSIEGLKQLNALGYGEAGSDLVLNLMFNPIGPSLPPPQTALEADYRKILGEQYGIRFSHLHTLTNMPIKRFGSTLVSKGGFDDYMALLRGSYCADNLEAVMCRTLISVDWQGYLYDCDFNQMLEMSLQAGGRERTHISDLQDQQIEGQPIAVADHCYGCTAGQGSSCGGQLD
ncbi:radical SAM protein [Solemya pervernicosa gill symbiont]|uniref:Radical SAM protein n=2 Tax=Gammaproteobacteria incertae sedis TaxID=118884 RepID=A0A1T2L831_9GAMM|nr:arsenosugar biosynthesis radical SAM (seleno)protein ArsS [Candidatus Reidiella endopervernicosa]OOZ41241.1 radical SAM protein [Solemya pervernicosa gill symbiont]QKQ25275.1 arsenosugar biosynthesis radical SAM protein ArsS [Candidatus Reidiella endopervernicosa]